MEKHIKKTNMTHYIDLKTNNATMIVTTTKKNGGTLPLFSQHFPCNYLPRGSQFLLLETVYTAP